MRPFTVLTGIGLGSAASIRPPAVPILRAVAAGERPDRPGRAFARAARAATLSLIVPMCRPHRG